MEKLNELKGLIDDTKGIVERIEAHDLTFLFEEFERFLDKYNTEDPDEIVEAAASLGHQIEDLAAEVNETVDLIYNLEEFLA